MKIGKNIRTIREDLRLEVHQVANDLNLDINQYLDIEADKTDITLTQLEAIANRLSCSVVDIIQLNDATKGIRNYFNNNNGNQGTIVNVQGINQEEIRKAYKELYAFELNRIPKLEKLLRDNNISFDL